jgi:hypothetical protein
MLKRYVIERNVPGIGSANHAAATIQSNTALEKLAPDVQWEHSYVTADMTYCIYLAEDEAAIRKHAELSGFPANKISEVIAIMDPTTTKQAA